MEGWRKGNAPPLGPVFKVIESNVCVCNMSNGIDHFPREPGALDPFKVHGPGVYGGAPPSPLVRPPPISSNPHQKSADLRWTYNDGDYKPFANFIMNKLHLRAGKESSHIRVSGITKKEDFDGLLTIIWRKVVVRMTREFDDFREVDFHMMHYCPMGNQDCHKFMVVHIDKMELTTDMFEIDVVMPASGDGPTIDVWMRSAKDIPNKIQAIVNDKSKKPRPNGRQSKQQGGGQKPRMFGQDIVDSTKKSIVSDFISQVMLHRATGRLNIG